MGLRRLPVIQEPPSEDAEAARRPPWQWVLIGSGLLVTIWLPIVALALLLARAWVARRAGVDGAAVGAARAALLVGASYAFASASAGYLVARFGPRTEVRHAAGIGLSASIEIWALAALGGAFLTVELAIVALLSLGAISTVFCAVGAVIHRRRNNRSRSIARGAAQ